MMALHRMPHAFIGQMLSLASTSIALCQGAHLGALKMYNKEVFAAVLHQVGACFQLARFHLIGGPGRSQTSGPRKYLRTLSINALRS